MRIQDVIHFSPKYKVTDLDLDNPLLLMDAFKDRMEHYYLIPISVINNPNFVNHAFAAGTILMTTIDALTNLFGIGPVGERFRKFAASLDGLAYRSDSYKEEFARKFYNDFRNGLIHEGRIKNCSQFSYDYSGALEFIDNNALVINPTVLEKEVRDFFMRKTQQFDEDSECRGVFLKNFRSYYSTDIQSFILAS